MLWKDCLESKISKDKSFLHDRVYRPPFCCQVKCESLEIPTCSIAKLKTIKRLNIVKIYVSICFNILAKKFRRTDNSSFRIFITSNENQEHIFISWILAIWEVKYVFAYNLSDRFITVDTTRLVFTLFSLTRNQNYKSQRLEK